MISLDINNTFNSLNKNDILLLLDKYKVPYRKKKIIASYLHIRKIRITDDENMEFNLGVPQGSSMGAYLMVISSQLITKCFPN